MSESRFKGSEIGRKELLVKERKVSIKKNYISYFILHNIISMFLFFVFGYATGLFDKQTETISDLFKEYYLSYFATTFLFLLMFGIMGRLIAYYLILKPFYKYVFKRKMIAEFMDYNDGINKLSFGFVVACLISAFFFTIGLMYIIQNSILKSNTFYALVIAYIIMKVFTFLLMKLGRYIILHFFTGMKL